MKNALTVTITAVQADSEDDGSPATKVIIGDGNNRALDDSLVSIADSEGETPIAKIKGPRLIPRITNNSSYFSKLLPIAALLLIISTGIEIGRKEAEMMLLGLSQDAADTLCGGLLGMGLTTLAAQSFYWMRHRRQNSTTRADENSINAGYGTFTAQ